MNNKNNNTKIIAAAPRRSTTAKALEQFLSDLLTRDEQEHIAQRIQIAGELISDTSVDETARKVKTPTSTVSDVMQIIKHGVGGLPLITMRSGIPHRKAFGLAPPSTDRSPWPSGAG